MISILTLRVVFLFFVIRVKLELSVCRQHVTKEQMLSELVTNRGGRAVRRNLEMESGYFKVAGLS